jgi:hypothetical protein
VKCKSKVGGLGGERERERERERRKERKKGREKRGGGRSQRKAKSFQSFHSLILS